MSLYLSKSDFLKYQICPSYFWLWKHKPELVPADEEEVIKQRLEQGNQIERYARLLFPTATLVNSKGRAAKSETDDLISQGVASIFQATALTDDGLLAMADAMVFDDQLQSWTIYEVKSTNSIKQEHYNDVAFQRAAFENAGYKIEKTIIIHLNKEYRLQATVDPDKLLLQDDVTGQIEKILPVIHQQIHDALEVMQQTEEPKSCSCRLKTKSSHCPTFHYFNPDIPEYSVFNISRIGSKKLALLIDGDVYHVKDVADDVKLSEVQRNQINVAKSEQPIINHAAISELLSDLKYPLYFLDYETVSTALPLYIGCTPYQQIPFQYSLHVIESPGSELKHYEFLGRDKDVLPAEALLDSLFSQVNGDGTYVVWNKSFESGRNREMARFQPKYANMLLNLNDRIFDLMEVFSKQHYVHYKFKGSNSIKAVLHVLVPEFSYKALDIQNGQIAAIRWYDAVAGNVSGEQAQKTFESLLKYCCLDTLAMVKIYEYLSVLASAPSIF